MKTGDILKIISIDNYMKDITTTTEGTIILIEQCKFFGSKPSKESKSYTYFEC